METTGQTFNQYLTALRILHGAMVMGLLMFMVIIHFVLQPEPEGDSALFVNLMAGFLAICIALSYWLYGQRVAALKTEPNLSAKLEGYRSASIIKFALLEGPSLAALVFYLVSGNIVLLGIGALGAMVLAINHPTAMKIKTDLDLSPADNARVDNPNEVVM